MNKAFKVLWNRLRGSYVVASEATAAHGKSGKAAKTVLAAAAASLVACGGVSAADSLVVLNTMMAESLDYAATFLENAVHGEHLTLGEAVQKLIENVLREEETNSAALGDTLTRADAAGLLDGALDVLAAREDDGWFPW